MPSENTQQHLLYLHQPIRFCISVFRIRTSWSINKLLSRKSLFTLLKYKLSISDITDAIAASLLKESQMPSLGHIHRCAVCSHSLTTDQYKPPCFNHRPIKAWGMERWIHRGQENQVLCKVEKLRYKHTTPSSSLMLTL